MKRSELVPGMHYSLDSSRTWAFTRPFARVRLVSLDLWEPDRRRSRPGMGAREEVQVVMPDGSTRTISPLRTPHPSGTCVLVQALTLDGEETDDFHVARPVNLREPWERGVARFKADHERHRRAITAESLPARRRKNAMGEFTAALAERGVTLSSPGSRFGVLSVSADELARALGIEPLSAIYERMAQDGEQ